MEFVCLVCNKICSTKRGLSTHVRIHNMTIYEYKEKFNLLYYCPDCGKEINPENKTGKCNRCRNRTGKNNSFFEKSHTLKTKKLLSQKHRILTKEKWKNPDYRKKVISGISKPRNKQFGIEQSKRVKEWYRNNPEQKEIRSEYMKKNWENGIITKNDYSSNYSHLEKELFEILKEINPNFKEKETLKINKKWFFPDIVDLDKKLIVEFYGDFWHCNPKFYNSDDDFNFGLKVKDIWNHDKKRKTILNNDGYEIFIVWEYDFKNNLSQILKKIKTLV